VPDPSVIPFFKGNLFKSQRRILADFDGDGWADMALSDETKEEPHITFNLYLKSSAESNSYLHVGYFYASDDPFYLTLERFEENGQKDLVIWVYWQQFSGQGLFSRFDVQRDGTLPWRGRILKFANGEKCEGSDILNDMFNQPRSIPVRWEQSIITNDVFKWVPVHTDHHGKKE
jgi:hypothetical protein